MKKIWLIFLAAAAFSCGNDRDSSSEAATDNMEAEEKVDEYSGTNITPQVEDSAGRLQVDTIGSAESADNVRQDENDSN